MLSLSPATFVQVCTEIGEWVYRSGFKRMLILNGHGPNLADLQAVIFNLQERHPDYQIGAFSWWSSTARVREVATPGGGPNVGHAGDAETSVYLALDPERVDMSKAVNGEPPEAQVFYYPFAQRNPAGCSGNALIATADKGRALMDLVVEEISGLVKRGMVEEPLVPIGQGVVP